MISEIEIPWSDGNRCYWPQEGGSHDPASKGHYSRVGFTHNASIQWRTKLGTELAKILTLPSDGTGYVLKDWPEGYALFIHHKGSRRDKYLYGFSGGKHFRSAAEFLPHASWLVKGGAEPSVLCRCHLCSKLRVNSTDATPLPPPTSQMLPSALSEEQGSGSHPSTAPRSTRDDQAPVMSLPPLPMDGVRRSKRRPTTRIPEVDSTRISRVTAYYVRASIPNGASTACGYPSSAGSWPILHELVWCKLQKPIECSGVVIGLWPGIVKRYEERSADAIYVSLLGNKHDAAFTIDRLLPYQAYRMEETLVQELRRRGAGTRRIPLLNMEKVIGTKLDDAKLSVVSSTCVFALTFSQHLSTVWSCTSDLKSHQPSPSACRLRRGRKPGTPQRPLKKEYNTLWWGPERIRLQQIVRLKASLSSVRLDQQVLNAQFTPEAKDSGPTTSVFLKIRSIFSETLEARNGGPGTNPFVSGVLFGLVSDADQRARNPGQEHDLPSPPKGHTFFPLLKDGFEAVLPIVFISGRYYPDIPGKGAIQGSSLNEARLLTLVGPERSAESEISPTVYKATRAEMVEHAYREGKGEAQKIVSNPETRPV